MSYAISFFGIFARIVDSLAWPAVAVFLIWILRDVLRQGLAELIQRPGRKLPEASDPRTGLVLAMHEIKNQTQATLRSGGLDPEQARAARELIDQLQQAIVATAGSSARSAGRVRETASGQETQREEAPRPEAPKKKKKRKSPKGS